MIFNLCMNFSFQSTFRLLSCSFCSLTASPHPLSLYRRAAWTICEISPFVFHRSHMEWVNNGRMFLFDWNISSRNTSAEGATAMEITLEEGERQIYHPMISRTRNDAARTFGKDRKTERTCTHWKARSRFWEKAYALNRPTARHAFARISIPVQFFSTLFLKGSTNVTWAAADIMMQEASVPLLYTLKTMQRQWQSSSSSAVV